MYVYVKIGLAPDSSVPVCGGHKVSPCLMLALVGRVAMAVAHYSQMWRPGGSYACSVRLFGLLM